MSEDIKDLTESKETEVPAGAESVSEAMIKVGTISKAPAEAETTSETEAAPEANANPEAAAETEAASEVKATPDTASEAGTTPEAVAGAETSSEAAAEAGTTPDTAAEDGTTPNTAVEDGTTSNTAAEDGTSPDTAAEAGTTPDTAKTEASPEKTAEAEPVLSMDDFKEEIARSFKKIKEGDIIKGTVIGISETEVILDLGSYTEGIIKLEELSNDPGFSIKADVTLGEELSAIVIREDDGQGNLLLSRKRADDILSWDKLKDALEHRTVLRVKIAQAVKAGVVAYLYGVRAFIPASQLSISYVENLESWVGKEVDVIVITASPEDKKLVLSGKEVERELDQKEKKSKLSRLQTGIVTTGTVEKIAPYGAFVNIGEGLTGLVHVSQICGRRIKSPSEVIKEGDTVAVKILEVKDGKIRLSMKAVEEKEDVVKEADKVPSTYSTGGEATTGLAALLKDIKL